jgi:hypothetical protein
MKTTTSRRGSPRCFGAALAALGLATGCTSNGSGPSFGASDDAGGEDAGGSNDGSGGGGGPDGSSSSEGGQNSSHDGGDGGDVARAASCRGTPASCSSMASQVACTNAGCVWGACTGSALPCAGLDQSKCGIQQNCTYDSLSQQCSGSVDACNVLSAAYGCTTQQGCTWQMNCSGVPTITCSSLSDSAICTAAGCLWN